MSTFFSYNAYLRIERNDIGRLELITFNSVQHNFMCCLRLTNVLTWQICVQ